MSENQMTLDAILEQVHALGYDEITSTEGYSDEASGPVLLQEQHRREPAEGLRRFLPRIYCDAGNPDLIPEDLRRAVERHGWTAQAMGRNDQTVTVIISKNGV